MENQFLLDVRTRQEFEEARIDGSINLPMDQVPNNLAKLSQIKKEILIICRSGARAGVVEDFLNRNGITNTKVLSGGLMANSHLIN